MDILKKERKMCICCMQEHDVFLVNMTAETIFKGKTVSYIATSEYCENADEYFETQDLISKNDIALKDAYRNSVGLLDSAGIAAVRQKYDISQSDLAMILGWGEKTITRYESHQVQDMAHDAILKKIAEDPEWFLSLLESALDRIPVSSFNKYVQRAEELYENDKDYYLRKSILAEYRKFSDLPDLNGNQILDLNKVIAAVNYFAKSVNMEHLYKTKLMRLLWLSDALSFKRSGHSITGLVYRALPTGTAPLQQDLLIDLNGINHTEVELGEGVGYQFIPNEQTDFSSLSDGEIEVLDSIIAKFGHMKNKKICESISHESALILTPVNEIVDFNHCKNLSLA